MNRSQLHVLACLGLFLLLLPCLASPVEASLVPGTEEIGKEKARIFLADEWQTAQIDPSLGPHQWLRGNVDKTAILVIEEVRGLFLEEADFVSTISTRAALTQLNLGKNARLSKVAFRKRREVGIAGVSVGGKVDGQELHFEFRLVGRDGLGYLILVWSEKRNDRDARLYADQVVDSLIMPGPRSPWRRGLKPKTSTESVNGQRISVAAPPSLLSKDKDAGDGFLGLSSADGDFGAYFYLHRFSDTLDSVLDEQAKAIVLDMDELKLLRRSTLEIDGRPARMAAYEARLGELNLFIESFVTDAGEDSTIELRVISEGVDGAHAEFRESLLASVQMEDMDGNGAFPALDEALQAAEPEPPYGADPDLAKLRSISKEHVTLELEGYYPLSVTADEGGFFINTTQGTHRFDFDDSKLEEIFRSQDGTRADSTVILGKKVYTAISGELCTVKDGVVTPMDVEAQSVAAFGKGGLLLLREVEHGNVLGFQGDPPSVSQLVARSRAGKEQVVYSSMHQGIVGMAALGNHVILELMSRTDRLASVEVMILELSSGAAPPKVEPWRIVESIRPAPDGWLVTGQPKGDVLGTYLMGKDGTRRRILDHSRINVLGVSPDERLYYLGSSRGNRDEMSMVSSVSLADLAQAAPFQAPWSAADLGVLAREAFPKEGLGNTGEAASKRWMPFLARADALSRERFNCGFPVHPQAVDSLIGALSGSEELDEDGRQLLVAVTTFALGKQGGVWALSPSATPTGVGPTDYMVSNELCVGINVGTAVFQVGNAESDAYDIVQDVLASLNGRELLIGTDSGSLRRAVASSRNPLVQIRFDEVDLDELKTLSDASPSNGGLRSYLYRHLILNERSADAIALASHHAGSEHANATDVALSIGSVELTKESAGEVIASLKDAIKRFPYTADLYVLLGEAYEAQRGKGYKEFAYACFARAESMLYGGSVLERATAGMGRTEDS